ncbi:MAG: hypothetical protein ACI4HM_10320 [Ruminococcus sp.]
MKPETKRIKELDRQQREKIIQEARKIAYNFKRWGFRLDICPLHLYSGWAKMTPEQVYTPEIYNLYLYDECVAEDMYITDLKKAHIAAKRYRHDHGIKKLQENIKKILE